MTVIGITPSQRYIDALRRIQYAIKRDEVLRKTRASLSIADINSVLGPLIEQKLVTMTKVEYDELLQYKEQVLTLAERLAEQTAAEGEMRDDL